MDTKTHRINLTINNELYEKLQKLSKETSLPIATLIRTIILKRLAGDP